MGEKFSIPTLAKILRESIGGVLPAFGKVEGMGSSVLTLNEVWSGASVFTVRWSHGIESNKAQRVLHYLTCRLYDVGRGNLVNATITLAQTTLAEKLKISRQWIGALVSRLEREGWLEHASSKLPDGTNSSTVFRVGRMFKRLLVMLSKSHQRKTPVVKPAKRTWHFSPQKREKEILSILAKEKEPPSAEVRRKIPLLDRWMKRGERSP